MAIVQIFIQQNLAFFAVPKTGTTAYEMALRRQADILFTKRYKHMTVGKFHKKTAPFLQDTFDITPERLAVMRNPIDQIRSWYKYRGAERLGGSKRSTAGITFDEFVLDVIRDTPPPHAGIGSQFGFLSLRDGTVPIDHLFAYETQDNLLKFLEERFEKDIEIKQKNVSPPRPAPLSNDVEKKLRHARADEFALYDQLLANDGHLNASMR